MTISFNSVKACGSAEFVDAVVTAFKRGVKLITYRCDGCQSLRQFERDRNEKTAFVHATCECNHIQTVLALGKD